MIYLKTLALMHRFVEEQVVPGVTYGIIDGSDQLTGHFGYQALVPQKQLLHSNELYDLASLTKVVGTTPLIVKLLAEGRLSLSDSISRYLPGWGSPQVTVRHLITHTSDIVGYIPNRNELPKEKLIPALLGLGSGEQLGKQVRYQDYNFIFLGWIASKILGKPVQQLITEDVLKPLGLNKATFHPTQIQNVVPTADIPGRGVLRGTVHDPKTQILGADCGAAGLFAPLDDLLHFARWLLGQIQYPGFISDMWLSQLFIDQTPAHLNNRSLGWILRDDIGHPYLLHTGYTGTLMIIDRVSQRAFVFLSNRVHPDAHNVNFLPLRSQLIETFTHESV